MDFLFARGKASQRLPVGRRRSHERGEPKSADSPDAWANGRFKRSSSRWIADGREADWLSGSLVGWLSGSGFERAGLWELKPVCQTKISLGLAMPLFGLRSLFGTTKHVENDRSKTLGWSGREDFTTLFPARLGRRLVCSCWQQRSKNSSKRGSIRAASFPHLGISQCCENPR